MPKKDPTKTDPASTPEPDRAVPRKTTTKGPAADRSAAETPLDQAPSDTAPPAEEAQQEACPPGTLQAELQEAKDRALRMQAELENYRKRAAREIQEERRYASLPLMRDLLPVLDNMDRAIEAAENTHDAASLLEGVKMVAQELQNVLERHHCTRIEALNELFDPHLHEAVSQQPSDQHPEGTVLRVAQNGFRLHDRVVRPSQVVVSTTNKQEESTP